MLQQVAAKRFTHIIVGAGSAGCLLANRLSADPTRSVLLIEAGFDGRYYPWHQIPVGYLFCMGNPRTDWNLVAEPCKDLHGRQIKHPRGKGLGGSSSINGMIYMRGIKEDYDRWAEVTGDQRWCWKNCLPRFIRHENHCGGANEWHGAGNELCVSRQRLRWEVLDAFGAAAVEYGVPYTDDYNRGDISGVAYFEVNQCNGWRWSSNHAFLQPIRKLRPNLTVMTHTEAGRLHIHPQTMAVESIELFQKGATQPVICRIDTEDPRAELLLSAGAFKSPQILQASGVGPEEALRDAGVKTLLPLPGVGANLQDHLQIRMEWYVQNCATLNQMVRSPLALLKMGIEYAWAKTGPLSMAPSQLGIMAKSHPSQSHPNLEIHVQPLSLDAFGQPLHKFAGITAAATNLNPTSRGVLRIRSPDTRVAPRIEMNYLSTTEDRQVAIDSIKVCRAIATQKAFAKYLLVERKPGPEVESAEDLTHAAGNLATTIFHPVGTCRMGKATDESAVVTPDLKVRGIKRLRVVDASIMPYITTGNTNSPTMLIAETAAEHILKECETATL